MKIEITSQIDPAVTVEAFMPPGHAKLIVQQKGKFPQDGIPLTALNELVTMLTEYRDHLREQRPGNYPDPYARAARALTNQDEHFTPCMVPGGNDEAYFIVKMNRCARCHLPMLDNVKAGVAPGSTPSLAPQARRAGWKISSGQSPMGEGYICQECFEADPRRYECLLCGEKREKKEVKRQFKHADEILCIHCFNTVSARVWDDAEERLSEMGYYD